jgi:SAM-dependent methyltransferase
MVTAFFSWLLGTEYWVLKGIFMLRDPQNIESNFIRDLLDPSAGNVLEVGCGDGRLTGALTSVSDSVLGLDPDPDSIDQARTLLDNGIGLILGSGENIPLADDSVDTVVFSLSLHHHPDPDNALAQARRVLRERGRILVLEPMAESPINRLFRIIHDEDDAYDRAAGAIDTCGLEMADRGTYETDWRFDNFEELVGHLYSYFDFGPEKGQVKAMEEMLGSAAKDRPLVLEDSTRWWLLKKTP